MRRAIVVRAALLTGALGSWLMSASHVWTQSGVQRVGITQIVSHPGLDLIKDGIIKGLGEKGFQDGRNIMIVFRNANGDPSLAIPIAQEFVRARMDLIIPITTPSTLAVAKASTSTPIVFGAVTDPVGVGLVGNLERPGGHITGTSDRWPFGEQFRLFKKVLPALKRVGVLYRPGDDISHIGIAGAEAVAPALGIEIVKRPVSSASDIYPSAVAMLRDVDAIYTGMDQLVVENFPALKKAADEASKPVLAGDEGSVERGALVTTAISMFDIGVLTGHIAARVLTGERPGDIPVQVLTSGRPVINRTAVRRFGINLDGLDIPDVRYFD